jgi:hypothetical protein
MKTGTTEEISVIQKSLLLSLIGLYCENSMKTALVYTIHHNQLQVTHLNILKAMKYELFSEYGCGIKLKKVLQEIIEKGIIEDLTQYDEQIQYAVHKYYKQIYDSWSPQQTNRQVIETMVDTITDELTGNECVDECEKEEEEKEKEVNELPQTECTCQLCERIDQSYQLEFHPNDEFEKTIYSRYFQLLTDSTSHQ